MSFTFNKHEKKNTNTNVKKGSDMKKSGPQDAKKPSTPSDKK